MKEGCIRKLSFHVFWDRGAAVIMLNGFLFLQQELDNIWDKVKILYDMSMLTPSETKLCFYKVVVMSTEAGMKKLNVSQNAVDSAFAGVMV